MRRLLFVPALVAIAAALLLLVGCESARLPVEAGMGPNPQLPPPRKPPIPVVEVATAKGWPEGVTPTAAAGWRVNAFATGLEHPRWLYVLPNGDVLVAETSSPPKPEEKGLLAAFMRYFFKQAGSAVPSANRITLLRDADGDGVAETKTPFLTDLSSPFGMALVGDTLYVANADALVRFPYREGETSISAAATKVADLPSGINHHWTKSLVANRDGSRLYVGVGSNSNVAEKGMEIEVNRANILEIDPSTGTSRVFASGLRNPVGLAWQPSSGALWTAVNERDELGSDLVPDYMTSVKDGGFYGWPYSYYGQHVDDRVKPQRPDLVAKAIVPDYALGPHTASLGLTFDDRGAYVGQHGSWNRRPRSGYRVIFVPFTNGMPAGDAQEVLTGFLDDRGNARGRPVGVILDKRGALLVADDVGNAVWRASR
ncbi:MAG TPA: sorbosone dehydrogenase family protein [Thermoanaerobaculia bacterium]|nr:sorbosone dehydrogenase family protein [Thermoanaerobaculia bacterium]